MTLRKRSRKKGKTRKPNKVARDTPRAISQRTMGTSCGRGRGRCPQPKEDWAKHKNKGN